MSSLHSIIEDVAVAARADAEGRDPEAHTILLHSIQRLTLAAEKPLETAKRLLYQPPINISIRVAAELGLFEAVGATHGGSITAREIAKLQNVDELLVVRIMRALTAVGICDEPGPREYSPNSVTSEFTSGGLGDGVKCIYDTVMPAAANIVECLTCIGPRVPKTPQESAFAFAEKATLFEWMKKNPKQRKYFDNYMAGRRKEMFRWFEIFPITDKLTAGLRSGSKDVLIVDIGASHGHDLVRFKERHNDLSGRFILQDLPETIDSIKIPLPGIEPMIYDFFTPQPVIGSRIYYFGTVCHDWADEPCIEFLSNTAEAMEKEYSTLLIYDYVMPETGAPVRAAAMDVQMMSLFAGIERTESQWRVLLDASGMEIVQVWYSATKFESVIEARLK